jgi:phage portal protein BeeE
VAALLGDPRPDLTMQEILVRTQLYRDITGGALWTMDRNVGGIPAMITPFSAAEFRTEAVPPLIYGRYTVRQADGTWRPVPREQVVHFRDVNPYSWRETVSLVDVALQQLDLGHTVNRIVHRYLERAMFPGAVLSPDKDWHPTAQEWEDWKEAVEAWAGGPANAGAPLALPGATTASRVAANLTDLLPAAVLDRVEATVGSVFGTPPVVLGWLTGLQNSPWSQMAEARRGVYEDTIEPLWRDVETRVGGVLLSPQERAGGIMVRFDTSYVRALMDDREAQARTRA